MSVLFLHFCLYSDYHIRYDNCVVITDETNLHVKPRVYHGQTNRVSRKSWECS